MDDTSRAEQKTQPFSTARDLYSSNNYKAAAEQSRVRHFQNMAMRTARSSNSRNPRHLDGIEGRRIRPANYLQSGRNPVTSLRLFEKALENVNRTHSPDKMNQIAENLPAWDLNRTT
tara:strand:+ start:372 stop:722 length:351 start_codon:yes stop_codon:yes gene_type:complete